MHASKLPEISACFSYSLVVAVGDATTASPTFKRKKQQPQNRKAWLPFNMNVSQHLTAFFALKNRHGEETDEEFSDIVTENNWQLSNNEQEYLDYSIHEPSKNYSLGIYLTVIGEYPLKENLYTCKIRNLLSKLGFQSWPIFWPSW